MVDEIGPVPRAAVAGGTSGDIPPAIEWFNRMLARVQRTASTTQEGSVLMAEEQSDSVATTVAGIVADHNALLAKLKAAGLMGS